MGDVLHTTDAGNSWAIVPVKDSNGNIIAMQQVNRMDVTGASSYPAPMWFGSPSTTEMVVVWPRASP